jgi:hypothetical protein
LMLSASCKAVRKYETVGLCCLPWWSHLVSIFARF